ncbi:hypothetical protein F8M41_024570 [Gigaspora margarita]|uniref:Uncharacterized protein n=1 Tax=Gigaspora margarita TaxID=4874 RepID=A0A8H4ETB6_GIGMA|nr:hypothetical protein F8M41_024570 [Gigaspora margarita]
MIPKSLKLAQSKPIFKVYQEKNKDHPYKITSDDNLYESNSSASNNTYDSCVTPIFKPSASIIEPLSSIEPLSPIIEPLSSNIKPLSSTIKPLSPIMASSSNSTKSDNKSLAIDLVSDTKDINDKKLWPNSTTKSLLVYLSDHMKDYQFRKNQFYVKAALYLGKGKTGLQVASKIRWLINKYMKESANKTSKGASKWEFFMEMNEIFGNRENVHPDYLIDSTGKVSKNIDQPEKDRSLLKRKKCSKLSEDNKIYIQSMTTISESKILSAKTKQQQYDLKKEKLQFERKKFEYQKCIELESKSLELEKYKLELEYKMKLELCVKELELKYKYNVEVKENL